MTSKPVHKPRGHRVLGLGWLRRALAAMVGGYVKLCMRTMRWQAVGTDIRDQCAQHPGGVIIVIWHAQLLLSAGTWPMRRRETYGLISKSRDGDVLADVMAQIGYKSVRGSSMKPTAMDKAKGGAAALRAMVRVVRDGHAMALTPDGPRGPAEVMGEGVETLAKLTQAPVMVAGLAAAPAWRLNTWDRFLIPLPFSRGAVVYGGPLTEPKTETLQRALDDAQTQAQALVNPS